MNRARRGPLSREDWIRAAFAAIATGGIAAVAVEPLAAQLGATKGSFYWHFKNRDALIEAVLDWWERLGVDDVIEALAVEADPAERLKKLFTIAFALGPTERAAETALLGDPSHPAVRRRVRRVGRRRIAYMAEQLELLGWPPEDALARAMLISYLYLGYFHTAHVAPQAVNDSTRGRLVDLVFGTLASDEFLARR